MLAEGVDILVGGIGVRVVFGVICAAIAQGRGRSGLGWFLGGFLLACIGLVVLLVLPDLKAQEARDHAHRNEVRKLREQIKKERQVADERHDANRVRLEAHDRAHGLDTSDADRTQLGGDRPPGLPFATTATVAPGLVGTTWFYAHDGRQQGPVPIDELRRLWLAETIDPDALVWRTGMAEWTPITDVPGLLPAAEA